MNIAIISSKPNSFASQQFEKAIVAKGAKCVFINPQNTMLSLSRYSGKHRIVNGSSEIEKRQIDLFIPRVTNLKEYSHVLYHLTEVLDIFCPVNISGLQIASDKMRTLQRLSAAGVRVPKTILINSPMQIEPALEAVGFPCIIKSVYGSKGVGVCKADSFASAKSTIQSLLNYTSPILVEEFIPAAGKDIRAIVVGGRLVALMERAAPEGDFRANLSQGGEGKAINLTPELEKLSVMAAHALPLQIAGVDILLSKTGEIFVIEVNGNPGFGIQKITGIDIADAIISYSIRQYKLTGNRTAEKTYSSDLVEDNYLMAIYEKVRGNKIAYQDREGLRREMQINSPGDFYNVVTSSFRLNFK
jgi:ribosomal protein S6--L-glutamate ligase